METDFDGLAARLRKWAAGSSAHVRAAVGLLLWHDYWCRRADFARACIRPYRDESVIVWLQAREFAEAGPRCSTSELDVLRVAIAIGSDEFRLAAFGHIHRYKVAEAFAAALGQSLEGLIPEPGHTHPDFIPGTPETCGACAREAKDEGRRQR
jgi:hypothetical protein